MASTTSANMGLVVPTVGSEVGPTYATDINTSLGTIDNHNHSAGSGVQITPSGLNISSDLSLVGNNAINARSVRFTPQSTVSLAADLGCVYVIGADLYYNDTNANQVRITQNAGVAGSPGSITNLVSPATASYVSANQTFVWQSAVNTAANLDAQSVILRNSSASSNGLTLQAPSGLASNYNVVLPVLPASQSFLTIDASGNITAPITYSSGITAANIANNTITSTQIANNTLSDTQIAVQSISSVSIVSVGANRIAGFAGYTGTVITGGTNVNFGTNTYNTISGFSALVGTSIGVNRNFVVNIQCLFEPGALSTSSGDIVTFRITDSQSANSFYVGLDTTKAQPINWSFMFRAPLGGHTVSLTGSLKVTSGAVVTYPGFFVTIKEVI